MKIFFGSDHQGFKLKSSVRLLFESKGLSYIDFGVFNNELSDYPIYAKKVGLAVVKSKNSLGVLFCGSGEGMVIAANKINGIRAILAHNVLSVKKAKQEDDANIICLSKLIKPSLVLRMINVWISNDFKNLKRYKRRIKQLEVLEDEN